MTMKNSIVLSLFIALMSFGLQAQSFQIDSEASTVSWVGKKVTGKHSGTISIQEGTILQQGDIYAGLFAIDMTSINCTDLEGEGKGKLEGHLASPDFFDSANHGVAVFKLDSMKPNDDGSYTVEGELTIKGITNSIVFPASISMTDGQFRAEGAVKINRTKWDIKYGSGSFFDGLGDKMIYDDMEISLNLVSK